MEYNDDISNTISKNITEISCLFEITNLITENLNIEQVLKEIIKIISRYFSYSEGISISVFYQNENYKSNNYQDSSYKITEPIVIDGIKEGQIELSYNDFNSLEDIKFSSEEISLLKLIALQSSKIIENKRNVLALLKSRNNLSTTLNSIGDGVITTDRLGFINRLNPAATRMTGWNLEEAIDKPLCSVFKIIDTETGETVDCPAMKVLCTEETVNITSQTTLITKDGSRIQVSDSAAPVKDEAGEITDIILVFSDITREYEDKKLLEKKENQLRDLAESAHAILWEYNIVTDNWDYVAPQAINILGFAPEEWTDLNFWQNQIHPEDQGWAYEYCFECALKGEDHIFEYRFLTKAGKTVWLRDEVKVEMENNQPVKLRGFMIDITERKNKESKLEYLSYHDNLTGCYNRLFLEEEISRLDTKRQLPITIIMADVNGLKMINDSYGHKKGDELLIKVADLIRRSIRQEDIVARWGGDEFVIFLPQTDKKSAQKIYNRILKECDEEKSIPVSLGVGMAIKDNIEQNIFNVLKEADLLMYKNKLVNKKSSKSKIVKGLLDSLGAKSHETEVHALRMTKLAHELGVKINLSNEQLNKLTLLASLHDIGKTSISEEILVKPGKLTEDEWKIIREHPAKGYQIAIASEEFAGIAEEIMSHHEHWNGKGYPRGLKGDNIPYLSRIIAIIDAYDVMTTGRPYQIGINKVKALAEINDCAGTQFDPNLAREFIEMIKDNYL